MSLLDAEVQRIKFELGFNVLGVGAEPYIGQTALFDQVIKPYLLAGAVTTSSTVVTASATPTPVTLTLASGTGFASLARVVVDVDSSQETASVQSIAGNTITVLLSKAHVGTYPVTVEGGESIVRELLTKLRDASTAIADALQFGGIKSLDKGDVEFFGNQGQTTTDIAMRMQTYYRTELNRVLFGVGDWRLRMGGGGGGRIALY